jgi:hypothetical protein
MTEPDEQRVPGTKPGTAHSNAGTDPAGDRPAGAVPAGGTDAGGVAGVSEPGGPGGIGASPADSDLVNPDPVNPDPAGFGQAADPAEMAGTIAVLADESLDTAQRRRAFGRLATQIRSRGVTDLFKPRAAMRWIADAVGDIVPHLPIRDVETLRRHFPGMSDDQIAERLVRNAALATAAVGAAGGGIAAVEWVATPTLLSAPIVLATETVSVVVIEIKLIGELHEVYGAPIEGSAAHRGIALLQSWAQRRGVNPMVPGVGVAAVLGTGVRRELRDRLLKRFGRNLTSYGPMLTGAAVASYLNRRATIALAGQIRTDLIRNRRSIEG